GLRGWLLVQQADDFATAIELLELGLAGCAQIGFGLGTPSLMSSLAEALAAVGDMPQARSVVDQEITISSKRGELLDRMQALTVKGDLCAASFQEDEAAACFEEVIASARRQSARSMELRAATRLARLRQRQGKPAEAVALLSGLCGWFTEGFDRPDLCE